MYDLASATISANLLTSPIFVALLVGFILGFIFGKR
jgi:hypothetical protein